MSTYRIRAVTFDVGGTLIEPWPSVGHVYAQVAAEFGPQVSAEALTRRFHTAWRMRKHFDYSRAAWRTLVNESFADLAGGPLENRCFDAIYERFGKAAAWRVFDDVWPALKRLRACGLKLGVVSNWDERLRPLLAQLKLSDYFDGIVVSCDADCVKPDSRIFEQAADLLATQPASILHVGDGLNEDLNGAQNAGLQAVLLERRGDSNTPSAISTLASVEAFLESNI